MYGQLVPCGGGHAIPLVKPRLVVGRAAECDITLPFGTVSSKHCLLEWREGTWQVTDLGSRNGVRVNGVPCETQRLSSGSILAIAQHRFEVDYGQSGGHSSPAAAVAAALSRPPTESTSVELPVPPAALRPAAASRSVELGELIPCGGGPPIPLRKMKLLVGRLPTCDIPIPHPTVSSKHCELEFKEGFWHVRDLGSRNGVRVGGICHLGKFLLPGDILSIAKLRYEIAYTPTADEPPPEENPFAMSLLEKAGLAGREALERVPQADTGDSDRKKRWDITAE